MREHQAAGVTMLHVGEDLLDQIRYRQPRRLPRVSQLIQITQQRVSMIAFLRHCIEVPMNDGFDGHAYRASQ